MARLGGISRKFFTQVNCVKFTGLSIGQIKRMCREELIKVAASPSWLDFNSLTWLCIYANLRNYFSFQVITKIFKEGNIDPTELLLNENHLFVVIYGENYNKILLYELEKNQTFNDLNPEQIFKDAGINELKLKLNETSLKNYFENGCVSLSFKIPYVYFQVKDIHLDLINLMKKEGYSQSEIDLKINTMYDYYKVA
ncbi:hypothetical protein PCC9214_05852 [Planktothrix tepida]|uniref:Uncharacterized protein n=1 Tax=Planktothrix tepida PCC 9214 TaxID=671072 RepID=A0A1J1LW39_9CYAN|nr:hypothetical protein [Planktothrix tepida]CAD5990806.1 hypothetical protein PCC9214_05852 [Planktothrix tepida]CUR36196.1 hypothetical protein PL9214880002 [Planktothrix tepida PCC 9214]